MKLNLAQSTKRERSDKVLLAYEKNYKVQKTVTSIFALDLLVYSTFLLNFNKRLSNSLQCSRFFFLFFFFAAMYFYRFSQDIHKLYITFFLEIKSMWKRIDLLYFQHNIIWRLRQLAFDHQFVFVSENFLQGFCSSYKSSICSKFFQVLCIYEAWDKNKFFLNKVSRVKIPKLAFGSLGILNLFELVRKCVKASEINFYDR